MLEQVWFGSALLMFLSGAAMLLNTVLFIRRENAHFSSGQECVGYKEAYRRWKRWEGWLLCAFKWTMLFFFVFLILWFWEETRHHLV